MWNSTSPISTKNGIGVSEKLVTDCTALRASCDSPGSPPRNSERADDVDGEEGERHRQPEPHQRDEAAEQEQARLDPVHRAQPTDVASTRRRALAAHQAVEAEDELDREQREARPAAAPAATIPGTPGS